MKVKILSKAEHETLKNARAILKRVAKYGAKLQKIRDWSDENKEKDKGGKKWKAATAAMYDLLDETWNVGIATSDDEWTDTILQMFVRQ